jgi:hypothetical protein
MANYQSVTVSENTTEENVSLEDQAAMQEKAANENGQTLESNTEGTEDRPEWLDEKFESPEDLAKAYKELQSKQSSKGTKKDDDSEEVKETTGGEESNPVQKASQEFTESGELSEQTFADLEKAGISKEMVETYIQGQQAISEASASQIQDAIGGKENFAAMSDWAGKNLTEGELQGYNAIVETGTVDQARVAVKGMYAQFVSEGGKSPTLNQGSTSGIGGAKSFGSAAAMVEAMSDPRYKNDPAYRTKVEKQLAASNAF